LTGVNFHVEAVNLEGAAIIASYDGLLYNETARVKITRGAMNLAAGLGSFMSGDRTGGITVAAGYALATGLIVYELAGLHKDDRAANIPGNIGIGIAGVAALYGVLRPFLHDTALLKQELSAAHPVEHIKLAGAGDNKIALLYSFSY
jgi:hypothetical protein